LEPALYIFEHRKNALDITEKAHNFDPVKQMSGQELFRLFMQSDVIIPVRIKQMSIPEPACIL
jgi:hypothetical protein